jgi:uncharacterized RDD family membrane protein YckC
MICRNHPGVEEHVHPCSRCSEAFCPDCLVTIQGRPFCAGCKTEQLLDVRSGVDRPRMAYARFWPRFGAQVLDGLLYGVPAYAIFVAVMMYVSQQMIRTPAVPPAIILGYLPLYVFPIVYEALMLTLKNGQTVGKMALRLRVVRPDGSPVRPGQAWGRAVMRLILGCFVVVDYIPYFFTDEKTTLHDMVAGTRVVESAALE